MSTTLAPPPARPIVRVWTSVPLLSLDRDVPWVVGPLESFTGPDGRTVVPRTEISRLRRVAGEFDALAIAHELDPAGPVAGLLPELSDGPRHCTNDVARALVGPPPVHPAVRRAARLLEIATSGSAALARAVDVLLDPIVFGVLGDPELVDGREALWVPLVAWRW
jgi:hypothetical protein